MTAIERAQCFANLRVEVLHRLSRLKATASAAGDYAGRQALLLGATKLGNFVATDFQETSLRDPFETMADALELAVTRYVSHRDLRSGQTYPKYAAVLLRAQARRVRLLVSTMQPLIAAPQREITEEEWIENSEAINQNFKPNIERPQWINF